MNRLVLILLLALQSAGCTTTGVPPEDAPTSPDEPVASDAGRGDDDGNDRPEADAALVIEGGAVADGPGISVAHALGWEGNPTAVLVNGAIFVDDQGTVLLCDAIAESFPPQCGGARLLVEGLELAGMPDLEEANGVRWAESVQLFGRVEPAD